MSKEINISSNNIPINIEVFSKDNSCKINVDRDLTLYYSSLAKKWAISDSLVDNEDYSAKYYAKNIKQNVANIVSEAKNEIDVEILLAKEQVSLAEEQVELAKQQVSLVETKGAEQVNLAKAQVDLAKQQVLLVETKGAEQVDLAKEQVLLAEEAVEEAQGIADSINGNFANVNLSNINEDGENVIKNIANGVSIGLPIGSIIPLFCSNTYIPEGLLPCDGTEYTQEQFPQFYTNYLVGNRIITCSFEEYNEEVVLYSKCAKFGLDIINGKFKVPTIPDGTFIQSAMTDDELGKSYKAGLPSHYHYITNLESYPAINPSNINANNYLVATSSTGSWVESYRLRASDVLPTAGRTSSWTINNSNTVQPNAVALRYFVVVANGSINQAEMDWSEWLSSLQGKLNADHSNDNKPYITEAYVNGSSGYLVYSNGLCEQWGQHLASSSNLVLLKPYKDANYMFNVFARCLRNDSADTLHSQVRSKTLSQIELYVAQYGLNGSINSNYMHEWFAVGYID